MRKVKVKHFNIYVTARGSPNILHYSQINIWEKFPFFDVFGKSLFFFLRILMENMNYLVDYMVYASLLGKSLFVAFGKSFFGFRKIFSPL